MLVPAEEDQLASVDSDTKRYDAELRPDLMVRAIRELQDAGIESDVWKIEGEGAALQIAANYLRFIEVYKAARAESA